MAGLSAVQIAPNSFQNYYLLDDGSVYRGGSVILTGATKIDGHANVGYFALTTANSVVALTTGSQTKVTIPAAWDGIVTDFSAGNYSLIAVLNDGTLGIAHNGADTKGLVSGLPSITDATKVSISDNHALALRGNGSVVGWGDNWQGKASPPSSLTDAIDISAGGEHSMALRSNGAVVTWGDDWAGQVALPAGLGTVVSIAAGGDHSLAVQNNGTVIAWGYDLYGQATVPDNAADASKVFATNQQSYAIVTAGKIVSWGRDVDNWLYIVPELQLPPGIISAELGFTADITGVIPVAGGIESTLGFTSDINGFITAFGPLSSSLSFSSDIQIEYLFKGPLTTELGFGPAFTGYQDWTANIPLQQLQEVYRLVITGGAENLVVGGISSWQATNQADGRFSYLQAVIPAASGLIDELTARTAGELIIQKGYRFKDGSERFEEILRSRFDTFRWDRGPSRFTATVSGYLAGKTKKVTSRKVTGVRSLNMTNGKFRLRCDIDLFLQPGMTVVANDATFVAGYINYYVANADKFCEIGER